MFKKINESIKEKAGKSSLPTMTDYFSVSYTDENPKKMDKMRKEIENQEKDDPTSLSNIFAVLDKNRSRNIVSTKRPVNMPTIDPSEDLDPCSEAVQFGHDLGQLHEDVGLELLDIETGEQIKPEYFTTYREIANIPSVTGLFSNSNIRIRRLYASLGINLDDYMN